MHRSLPIALALALAACTGKPDDPGETPDDTAATAPLVEGAIDESGVVTCAEPSARSAAPLSRTVWGEGWRFAPDYGTASWDLRWGGRGIVIGDLNGDGHLDIIAPQVHEPARLMLGVGDGTFTEGFLPDVPELQGVVGGAVADIDGDADLDVFLYGQVTPGVILVNDGAGGFTGTAKPEWDDLDFPGCGGSASFADYDLDGDLDLYYGRLGALRSDGTGGQYYFSCPSRLLENQGDGSFVDVSEQWLGDDVQELRVMASGWHQFDEDPWPELYVIADAVLEGVSDPNVPGRVGSDMLYDNGPEGLARRNEPSLESVAAGMGLGAADLNEDGIVDPMVPDVNRLIVLQSTDIGVWVDQATAWNLIPAVDEGQSVAWGGEYADLDNDTDLDLLVTYGAIPGGTRRQADELYLREGEGFVRAGVDWAWDDDGPSRGVLVADLNHDGWLDVIKREVGGVVMVDLAACGEESWLTVRLDAPGGNRFGVGATVRVFADGRSFSRAVSSGSTSFSSGGPPELHFGLGDLEAVDRIEVTWPDGTVTAYAGVATRQHLVVHHPDL